LSKLTFDLDTGAAYIQITDKEVARTAGNPGSAVNVDLDKDNNVVGIEILDLESEFVPASIVENIIKAMERGYELYANAAANPAHGPNAGAYDLVSREYQTMAEKIREMLSRYLEKEVMNGS